MTDDVKEVVADDWSADEIEAFREALLPAAKARNAVDLLITRVATEKALVEVSPIMAPGADRYFGGLADQQFRLLTEWLGGYPKPGQYDRQEFTAGRFYRVTTPVLTPAPIVGVVGGADVRIAA